MSEVLEVPVLEVFKAASRIFSGCAKCHQAAALAVSAPLARSSASELLSLGRWRATRSCSTVSSQQRTQLIGFPTPEGLKRHFSGTWNTDKKWSGLQTHPVVVQRWTLLVNKKTRFKGHFHLPLSGRSIWDAKWMLANVVVHEERNTFLLRIASRYDLYFGLLLQERVPRPQVRLACLDCDYPQSPLLEFTSCMSLTWPTCLWPASEFIKHSDWPKSIRLAE